MARVVTCVAALAHIFLTYGAADDNVGAVSPVEKVITMLEDLQTQVIMEGKMEAKTYDKFACFCKELSEQKNQDITDGEDAAADLTAQIETLSADRNNLNDNIKELTTKISTLTKEMADAVAKRKKENLEFLKLEAELDLGVKELSTAADELKAGTSSASFAQGALQHAGATAEALGFLQPQKQQAMLSALLEDGTHAMGSSDIVETIEDIEVDFKKELEDTRDKEVKAVEEHKKLMETKSKEKTDAESDLARDKEAEAEKTSKIGTCSQDLTSTKAVLMDDQAYLQDVTAKCNAKSKEWDQRSSMRSDEITAITTALTIVKGRVSEKTSEKTVRFLQMPRPTERERKVGSGEEDANEDEEEEVDEILDAEPRFLQLSRPRKHLAAISAHASTDEAPHLRKFLIRSGMADNVPVDSRERAIMLLKARAAELKSTTLAALASKAAADPFVKIRKLIQELIERLLQEAADEANHKGFCDKELGKANQKRDTKAGEVKRLNSEMAAGEAKRDQLTTEIEKLAVEIAELTSVLAKTTKEREDESAENSATVSEAQEGKAAVDEAIDVLSKFYKTAAKAEVGLAQTHTSGHRGVDEDMPDAGFGGAYKGSQGASGGIIGMMEVIQSDFVRTITETEKQERAAQKEFDDFSTATKSSLGTKKVGKEGREEEKAETINELDENKQDLLDEQALLDKSLQELIELQPACVDTGMSYEEKVAKREQEIESLKQALCALDQEGPVKTEPGCELEEE